MKLPAEILDLILRYTISFKINDFVKQLTDFKSKTRGIRYRDFDDITHFQMFSYRRHKTIPIYELYLIEINRSNSLIEFFDIQKKFKQMKNNAKTKEDKFFVRCFGRELKKMNQKLIIHIK